MLVNRVITMVIATNNDALSNHILFCISQNFFQILHQLRLAAQHKSQELSISPYLWDQLAKLNRLSHYDVRSL